MMETEVRDTRRTKRPRAKRVRFTPAVLERRPPASGRIEQRDDLSPLWLRITATGDRSFAVRARIKGDGTADPVRITYPERAHISNLAAAREWAIKIDGQCRAGTDPRAAQRAAEIDREAKREKSQQRLFENVAAAYLATEGKFRHNTSGWRVRTKQQYERILNCRLVPQWEGREIHSLTRDEITDYLAEVADATPVTANRDLAILSAMMSWYERQRGSGFTSPIVKNMAPAEESARTRVLADDEIRVVWHVAGRSGTYGGMVRQLLLLAARRSEVARMRQSQIGDDGIWHLPGDMTKNHEPLFLPLPADALSVIREQTALGDWDLVFSPDGKKEFTNWSRSKAIFDRRVLFRLRAIARAKGEDPDQVAPLPNWTLHDLRRTARSLMARAKVRPDYAERVLNHKIGGVEGTYDRHTYEDEKREALERLAAILRQIIEGRSAKVVQFPKRAAHGAGE